MLEKLLDPVDIPAINSYLSEAIFLGYRKLRVEEVIWRSRDLIIATAKETYPIYTDGLFSFIVTDRKLLYTNGEIQQEKKPYHKALVEQIVEDYKDATIEQRHSAICSLVAGDIEFKSKYTQRLIHRLCCQQVDIEPVPRIEQELIQLKPNSLDYKMVVGSSPPSEHTFRSYQHMLEEAASCFSTAVIVNTENGPLYTLIYFNKRKIMVYAWEEEDT